MSCGWSKVQDHATKHSSFPIYSIAEKRLLTTSENPTLFWLRAPLLVFTVSCLARENDYILCSLCWDCLFATPQKQRNTFALSKKWMVFFSQNFNRFNNSESHWLRHSLNDKEHRLFVFLSHSQTTAKNMCIFSQLQMPRYEHEC